MYYLIALCVAVLLHGTAALDGCNDTCSYILAVNGSKNFNVDCNNGVMTEYFKCISASPGCDGIAKLRNVKQSIPEYYPEIKALLSRERGFCLLLCWRKRVANESTQELITCSESGQCMCNAKGEQAYTMSSFIISIPMHTSCEKGSRARCVDERRKENHVGPTTPGPFSRGTVQSAILTEMN